MKKSDWVENNYADCSKFILNYDFKSIETNAIIIPVDSLKDGIVLDFVKSIINQENSNEKIKINIVLNRISDIKEYVNDYTYKKMIKTMYVSIVDGVMIRTNCLY